VKPVVPAENSCCSLHQLVLLSQAAVLKDSDLALSDSWEKLSISDGNIFCSSQAKLLFLWTYRPPTVPTLREAGCFFGKQLMFLLFLLGQAAVPKKHPT
jgi:hypothetical protein